MLCQACGKKTATTHVKTIVNGKLTEYHLCPDCAKQKGYNNLFSGWSMDLGNLLGGLLGKCPRRLSGNTVPHLRRQL